MHYAVNTRVGRAEEEVALWKRKREKKNIGEETDEGEWYSFYLVENKATRFSG